MFTPGAMELAVLLIIFILLFGANKLPKLARASGEALGEFKRGREQIEQDLEEMREYEEAEDETPLSPTPEDSQSNTKASAEESTEQESD